MGQLQSHLEGHDEFIARSPGSNVRPACFEIVTDPTEEMSGEGKEREKGKTYELFISL